MASPADLGIPDHIPDDAILHVYPVDDTREHITDARGKCWCNPTLQEEPSGYVVVHNSMDGREQYEMGQRKPN